MSFINFIFIFSPLLIISAAVTNPPQTFTQLIGYKILADKYLTLQTSDIQLCAQICSDSSQGCVGFFRPTLSSCKLLIKIRDIIEDSNACFYYVADRRNLTDTKNLTTIDQYTFYDAFIDGIKCPKSWNDEIVNCSMPITEEICAEYATFFKASFNGSFCVIPSLRIKEYTCTGPFVPVVFQNYCYFNFSDNVAESNLGDYYESVCENSTENATSLSIHSKAEDQFIYQTFGEIYFALYIPASVPWNKNSFRWADGSPLDYKNWATSEPRIANPAIEERICAYENGKWVAAQRYRGNWTICKVITETYHYV